MGRCNGVVVFDAPNSNATLDAGMVNSLHVQNAVCQLGTLEHDVL